MNIAQILCRRAIKPRRKVSWSLKNGCFEKTKQLLNDIGVKKVVGIDSVSLTFLKTLSGIMAKPLATVINNCFTKDVFPKNAKAKVMQIMNKM